MNALKIGANTIGFMWDGDFEAVASSLLKLGYRHFDVMLSPGHLDVDDDTNCRQRLLQFLHHNESEIVCVSMPSIDHNLASCRAEVRRAAIDLYKSVVDLASDLEAKNAMLVGGRISSLNPGPIDDSHRWMRESLASLIPYAERKGVRFVIENIPVSLFPKASDVRALCQEFNSPALGVCYDVSNATVIGEDIVAAVGILGPSLSMVHLSDTPADSWQHGQIGTGVINFTAFARALKDAKYDGCSMIEVSGRESPIENIVEAHRRLAQFGWDAPALAN
jgi:L-ribulose-5-phosphate 3-epimerase